MQRSNRLPLGTQTHSSVTLASEVVFSQTKHTVDMADQSTMPSQDDDNEEVSMNSLHDVMAAMTRRFEQLLVKQEERQAKLFAELFDDVVVDSSKRPEDVTKETVSMSVEISTQNSKVDARRKRRELEEPPQTVCIDSVVSIPVALPEAESGTQQRQRGEPYTKMADGAERLARLSDNNAPLATEDTLTKEQSTDGRPMTELQCGPVNPREGLRSASQLESNTVAVRHTPNVRAVKGLATDDAGDAIPMLMVALVDRFCCKAGHHYVGCRDRRDRQYRRSKAVTYSTPRRSVGIG